MNSELAFEIIDLALSLIKNKDAEIAGIMVKIIQKGVQAYRAHTGEALDPGLIHSEEPV